MKIRTKFTALITLLFLVLQLAAPLSVRAALDMRTGPDGLSLIERYEGYSDQRYELNGRTYIGYGTACAADAYPDGITREEAEELLREALGKCESSINSFCDRSGLTPTQEQFDALVSFTFTLGDGWLSGTSDLVQIVRGDRSATRLETARAFGVWCHIGGKANTSLAQRRLEEAALYLDGNLNAAKEEFAYLIIQKEDGVTYETDFSVYLRGGTYDSFPEMTKKDYQFTGLRTKDGQLIKIGDKVTGNAVTEAEWKKVASAAPVTPVTPVTTTYLDVKPEDWFYSYVTDLSAAGVINGRGNGIFAPKDS
ncbi:MAG: S-layer homology domain-containing protein, partial [Oscillospiraceae bacterium]|nr:S-layer homology domain-containing protein [Oscillospiraceae bacterium]